MSIISHCSAAYLKLYVFMRRERGGEKPTYMYTLKLKFSSNFMVPTW